MLYKVVQAAKGVTNRTRITRIRMIFVPLTPLFTPAGISLPASRPTAGWYMSSESYNNTAISIYFPGYLSSKLLRCMLPLRIYCKKFTMKRCEAPGHVEFVTVLCMCRKGYYDYAPIFGTIWIAYMGSVWAASLRMNYLNGRKPCKVIIFTSICIM